MTKRRNRRVLLFFFLWVWLIWMTGPAWAGQALPAKTIHIITPEWDGQTNRDGSGFFFDILRAVYLPSGVKMIFTFAPWKRCQMIVSSGKADAMLCVWKRHARERNQLTPRYPIYVEQTAVVFKKASLISWKGIRSMDYNRLAWLRGYDYQEDQSMQGIQPALWEEVDSPEDAWRLLNFDRIDFYIDALIDLDAYIRENKIDMDLYQKEILWSTNAYLAFSNTEKSRQLMSIFDREIVKLFNSGELARIYQKWHQPFFPDHWQSGNSGQE